MLRVAPVRPVDCTTPTFELDVMPTLRLRAPPLKQTVQRSARVVRDVGEEDLLERWR